jgi:RimJ/RimL family protein N-acetyltransferase
MFKIVAEATGEAVGSVGYWARTWLDESVYEIGWSVLPAFQGRGIAGTATDLAIAMARSERKHRFLISVRRIPGRRPRADRAG